MVFAGHHLLRNAKTWWNIVTALVMTKLDKHFRNLDQCRALWNVLHPDGYAICNIVRFVREPLDVWYGSSFTVSIFRHLSSLVLPMDHRGVVAARSAEEELEQRLQLEANEFILMAESGHDEIDCWIHLKCHKQLESNNKDDYIRLYQIKPNLIITDQVNQRPKKIVDLTVFELHHQTTQLYQSTNKGFSRFSPQQKTSSFFSSSSRVFIGRPNLMESSALATYHQRCHTKDFLFVKHGHVTWSISSNLYQPTRSCLWIFVMSDFNDWEYSQNTTHMSSGQTWAWHALWSSKSLDDQKVFFPKRQSTMIAYFMLISHGWRWNPSWQKACLELFRLRNRTGTMVSHHTILENVHKTNGVFPYNLDDHGWRTGNFFFVLRPVFFRSR